MSTDNTSPEVVDEPAPAAPERRRLTLDLDVDVCVVGAGLAGLTVALEAARMGASVAVLESRHVGWNASAHHLGTVMPGYGVAIDDLIARLGVDHTRELWKLSQQGADHVRAIAGDLAGAALQATGALEVSNVDMGKRLIERLHMLGGQFGAHVEGWPVERVRAALKTPRYFEAIHYPDAFHVDARNYLEGLAVLARQSGVRIFEESPVVSIEASGIRKRIATASARLRAAHIVLAGNVHLGSPSPRLTATLLPVWRYAAVTEPLGNRLSEAIAFEGAVMDTKGIDHFRIVEGDRLMWASPETTWAGDPARHARAIRRRIATLFPALGKPALRETWCGTVGQTVHGMPQIGELQPGLWVASGFGRHGLNTTALAGQMIARGILWGDDRWRLFAPFELVWAGGKAGRVAGQVVFGWTRASAAAAGAVARWRERAALREVAREARVAAANRQMATDEGDHFGGQ
ncbi:MAG: FAD-binding oxidoreductase [Rhizobiales bacterium]|nr:FAD-binding oxidoreductase [Hyphomicrobiales bacterium]